MPFPLIAAGIGAIGALGAAGMSYYGQKQANRENIEHSREQMAFQERMSSTAYQRSMQDMRQAGLNPAVAYNQGGASTPTGSQPPGSKNRFENVASALSLMRMAVDINEAAARTEVLKKDVEVKANTAKVVSAPAQIAGLASKAVQTVAGNTTVKGGKTVYEPPGWWQKLKGSWNRHLESTKRK